MWFAGELDHEGGGLSEGVCYDKICLDDRHDNGGVYDLKARSIFLLYGTVAPSGNWAPETCSLKLYERLLCQWACWLRSSIQVNTRSQQVSAKARSGFSMCTKERYTIQRRGFPETAKHQLKQCEDVSVNQELVYQPDESELDDVRAPALYSFSQAEEPRVMPSRPRCGSPRPSTAPPSSAISSTAPAAHR